MASVSKSPLRSLWKSASDGRAEAWSLLASTRITMEKLLKKKGEKDVQ